jgi:hypothetical protein
MPSEIVKNDYTRNVVLKPVRFFEPAVQLYYLGYSGQNNLHGLLDGYYLSTGARRMGR